MNLLEKMRIEEFEMQWDEGSDQNSRVPKS